MQNDVKIFVEEAYFRKERSLTLVLGGWCFAELSDKPVTVGLSNQNKILNSCIADQLREDVGNAFPDLNQAKQSGYYLEVTGLKTEGLLDIVVSVDGGSYRKVSDLDLAYVTIRGNQAVEVDTPAVSLYSRLKTLGIAWREVLKKGYAILKQNGWRLLSIKTLRLYWYKAKAHVQKKMQETGTWLPGDFELPPRKEPYEVWRENNTLSSTLLSSLEQVQKGWTYRPLISLVMPVWNVETRWLDKAISSIQQQVYPNWELCIADDASTLTSVRSDLERWAAADSRVKVVFREQNGNISLATNSALELAGGEYILLMDNDDELAPHALFEIVRLLQKHPDADVIYSDDDKIDETGYHYAPQFKPEWSPELLLSYMYFSHIFCIKKSLIEKAGGFRAGFEGAQDYDLALRITELTDKIYHIPKVLYHWRAISGSTASTGHAKPEAFQRGINAVQEAVTRRGLKAKVYRPDFAVASGLGIHALSWPDNGPEVTIIIPTKNNLSKLSVCLKSLEKTTYQNYHVMIVDNISDDPNVIKYLAKVKHRVERIANQGSSFSYAYINNEAVKRCDTELVLFLNDDTEVIEPTWLSQLVGYLSIPGVGAAGARLLFPDNRVQHAGVIMGLYKGMAGPAFRLAADWDPGYLSYALVSRNYSAVTAACLLTRKETFCQLGGFDEVNFAVAYNDVDFCVRLSQQGQRLVYVPGACLKHYEGASRGFADNPREILHFRQKYENFIDPYYNVNLSLENEKFEISTECTLDYGEYLSKKPKLLMIGHNLNLEGAPFSQYEMTCGLLQRGKLDIEVFSPTDGPLRSYYEEKNLKVNVFEHPLSNVFTVEAYEDAVRKFADWINSNNFDIVYGNTMQTFYAMEAANRAGVPCIWNIRESEPFQSYFNFLPDKIRHYGIDAFKHPYRIVYVAEATKSMFEPLNTRQQMMVIHNGLQVSRIEEFCGQVSRSEARLKLGLSEDAVMILIVGTVCDRKGQRDFVNAAVKLLQDVGREAVFYVVGGRQSAYLNEIYSIINSHNCGQQIKVIMETNETYIYYRAADIFVCTSYNESYPRVTLEAMAFGLPIVTTPVFGIPEQVRENVNALYFQPGEVDQLAAQLSKILTDQNLRQQFSVNSPIVLECITSYQAMVDQYERTILGAWLTKDIDIN